MKQQLSKLGKWFYRNAIWPWKKYLHFAASNSHGSWYPSTVEHIEPLIFGDVAIVVLVCCQEIFSQLNRLEIWPIFVTLFWMMAPLNVFWVPLFVHLHLSSLVCTFLLCLLLKMLVWSLTRFLKKWNKKICIFIVLSHLIQKVSLKLRFFNHILFLLVSLTGLTG